MKFTPLDIKNQEFSKEFRGYDKDEVNIFLENLSEWITDVLRQNEQLKSELEESKEKIEEFKTIEKDLQNTLLNAHESSSKSVESAKKKTMLLIKEAELKASQILENAKEDANYIRNSVLKLKEERVLLIARIKAMIDSQLSFLKLNLQEPENKDEPSDSDGESKQSEIDVDDILGKLL